jgi:hypothetical protein
MEKKQTAVDYLVEQLIKQGFFKRLPIIEIQQASQMEKEQIVNAYWDGGQDVPMHISTCENYYNKTFGVETGIIVFDNIHLTNTNKINNGGNNE